VSKRNEQRDGLKEKKREKKKRKDENKKEEKEEDPALLLHSSSGESGIPREVLAISLETAQISVQFPSKPFIEPLTYTYA